eukprot:scaffold131254_cov18-Tisochrysis_lutea.AAC.3
MHVQGIDQLLTKPRVVRWRRDQSLSINESCVAPKKLSWSFTLWLGHSLVGGSVFHGSSFIMNNYSNFSDKRRSGCVNGCTGFHQLESG